jgi:hypothetical protein
VNPATPKYCLDANVLIQAWQKYYSSTLCPDYWRILSQLGTEGRIFLPKNVYEEIVRTEDDLSSWLKQSNIPIYNIDSEVTQCLSRIYAADPMHVQLVDNTRQRSLADPWVVAHAMKEKACVVTKEEKVTTGNRIKIPNVCDKMGVRWINDFELAAELGLRFSCTIGN